MNAKNFKERMAMMVIITQHNLVIHAITIRYCLKIQHVSTQIYIFDYYFFLQEDSTKVISRFDLNKTWREFVFFFGIPTVLFVVSFISLLVITRSVKVGDDAKMRCKYCADEISDTEDMDEIANKCVQQLNEFEEIQRQNEQMNNLPSTSNVNIFPIGLFILFSISIEYFSNSTYSNHHIHN